MPVKRLPVLDRRRAGILLHPTALGPEPLGGAAREFIDWLAAAGCSVWQVLPLGPTGAGGSPYWVRSDFAGNAALLGSLGAAPVNVRELERFRHDERHWLEDYALHAALCLEHGDDWRRWPVPLRDRAPEALAAARERSAAEIEAEIRRQLQFARAWDALRAYAHRRGVRVFGDLPIYVAPDAVDCWVRREQFLLDEAGYPRAVAGVPPDYFAATGQLWGNPLYDWEQAQRDNFGYFRARVAAALRRFDLLRIDHFRALQSHWAVPADAPDARAGSWQPTPGRALLAALCQDHPDRPFVAEDLGAMTPQVTALRDEFALPGMQVLQFAFDGDPANAHWPAHGPENAVAYVGTHDNDTALGWVRSCDPQTLQRAEQLLGVPAADLPQAMIDAVLAAPARLAVLTMPDLLGLGSEARFNTPGTATGNWQWRLPPGALRADLAERLRARVAATARLP